MVRMERASVGFQENRKGAALRSRGAVTDKQGLEDMRRI